MLLREQERQEGQDSTILKAGVLHQLNDAMTLSAGVGAGLGDDSPDVRLMFGFRSSLI